MDVEKALIVEQISANHLRHRSRSPLRWGYERILALVIFVNVAWVVFDLTYVRWRDVYIRYVPGLTQLYDPVKGIEPHRVTQSYLNTVDALQNQLGNGAPLDSPAIQSLLQNLRDRSVETIDDNPFQLANRLGAFERAKNRLRDRTGLESSKAAFRQFWTAEHLDKEGWEDSLEFFNRQIRPQFERNFYRNIDESGQFVEGFWRIDRWFLLLFSLEFLLRTWFMSRRLHPVSWRDAVLWRWYDILLLLPFWRWLRLIPLSIRWSDAGLVNVSPIRLQLVRGVSAYLAAEMTELIVVRVIDRAQTTIRNGTLAERLLAEPQREFINVNGVDTVTAIAEQAIELSIYKVLPQLQPEIEALLAHVLSGTYANSTIYRGLRRLPGMTHIPQQLTQQLSHQLASSLYDAAIAAFEDDEGRQLYNTLVAQLRTSLRRELSTGQTLKPLPPLLVDLLEEVKLNYVQQFEQEDVEQLLLEVSKLKASKE
ncbi:MAG: hypothetical protein AAGE92_12755 [Cyanobacteria bacterium P01_G01_bin.4]